MRHLLCLLLMSWSLIGWSAQMTMHVISRPDAEALVPVIGSLLVEGGTVNAYQGKLIIRTTPQNFNELQSVLGELNSKPRAVTVYLRRAGNSSGERFGADVELSHRTFSGTNATIQIQQQRIQGGQHSDYQVRTLSGYPAGINQGTLLALSGGDNGTYLHSLERGIQVTPQVNTDGSVTLQIQQRHDQPGGPGIADTQHSSSTLRLQPGQWQQMGAINTVSQTRQRRIGSYQTSRQTVVLPIEVMVQISE
ncbi:type II and III secretion system protein [Alcanivorax sp. S6407]|uniref:type II and III secretion system protein n=1 Tax=Alcanivorax sp. S6407 TaxID=2926424 RepID=UPI001FF187F6|nr:type II and III secretion system protein [Alcanivorax sp. S6407]MCK0152385.1 type II and III secretion system protein [Alcanivorax sp. S6407]